jgi:hypothetical protein
MMLKNKILLIIFIYTLLASSISVVIDLNSLFTTYLTSSVGIILLFVFSIIVESVCLLSAIKLIMNQYSKYYYLLILIFWAAQIVFFGIYGNSYGFTTGPELAIYSLYVDGIEFGYFGKLWSQEMSITINHDSAHLYFGFNMIPLIISLILFYIKRTLKIEYINLADPNL